MQRASPHLPRRSSGDDGGCGELRLGEWRWRLWSSMAVLVVGFVPCPGDAAVVREWWPSAGRAAWRLGWWCRSSVGLGSAWICHLRLGCGGLGQILPDLAGAVFGDARSLGAGVVAAASCISGSPSLSPGGRVGDLAPSPSYQPAAGVPLGLTMVMASQWRPWQWRAPHVGGCRGWV